jgi:hypothetical protein
VIRNGRRAAFGDGPSEKVETNTMLNLTQSHCFME